MITYPKYYKSFSCIASACEDSCCKEWEVDVDEASAARYAALTGPLGERLRQVMTRVDGGVRLPIQNGRCPMWRQDGLCEIQAQLGHDALCHTCQTFPRLTHEYDGFTEMDLELSCPEAARLIFTADEAMVHTGQMPSSHEELIEILLESRQQAFTILEDTTLSLPQRLITLLIYAHHVQSWIDGGEQPQPNPEKALALAAALPGEGNIIPIIEFYVNLEILTDRWKDRLTSPVPTPKWDDRQVRFMTYGIRRYWLQAVSDYDLLCRVKFLIGACVLLHHLGGDPVSTAQLWSKEIEHDPDNVEALLDAAYTSPAFTDQNLLCLLRQ